MLRMFSMSDRRKIFNVMVLPDRFPSQAISHWGAGEWMLCSACCLWYRRMGGAGYGLYDHRTSHTEGGGGRKPSSHTQGAGVPKRNDFFEDPAR